MRWLDAEGDDEEYEEEAVAMMKAGSLGAVTYGSSTRFRRRRG